jgi:hypothetical protein
MMSSEIPSIKTELGIAPAPAASPADAIKEFGLLGTWAIHCEEHASKRAYRRFKRTFFNHVFSGHLSFLGIFSTSSGCAMLRSRTK